MTASQPTYPPRREPAYCTRHPHVLTIDVGQSTGRCPDCDAEAVKRTDQLQPGMAVSPWPHREWRTVATVRPTSYVNGRGETILRVDYTDGGSHTDIPSGLWPVCVGTLADLNGGGPPHQCVDPESPF